MRKMGGGKQMKLGILCTMINGFGRRGYYNSQEIGLGRALARKGHEVMIYKGIDPSEKEEKVQVEKNLTIWYLPMKHLGAHGFMDCKYLDPQLKALFCFGDQQIFLPHVYRWCRRRRIPFVAYVGTAHSLDSNFKSKVMNALFAAGTLRIYKKNPVLAKTSAAKEELRQLGVPHAVIAPVGLDNAVLKKNIPADEKMRLRKEHGFEADDVILCNVSRLSWEKRPLELIDLFLQVKGKKKFKLIIVGNGPLEEELNEKIRKKLKIDLSKVPYSLKNFGNTSGASIPLTIVTQCQEAFSTRKLNNIACAFGVGLAWGSVHFETNCIICPELIEH